MDGDAEEFAVSFDLLPDNELEGEEVNLDDLNEEQREQIYALMDTVNAATPQENDPDYQAFEESNRTFRFVRKTEAQIDETAEATNRESTRWQTKWAVKVFKGT